MSERNGEDSERGKQDSEIREREGFEKFKLIMAVHFLLNPQEMDPDGIQSASLRRSLHLFDPQCLHHNQHKWN